MYLSLMGTISRSKRLYYPRSEINIGNIDTLIENPGVFNTTVYESYVIENSYLTKSEYSTLNLTLKRNFRRTFKKYNSNNQASFIFISLIHFFTFKALIQRYTMKKKNARMGKGKGKDSSPIVPLARNTRILIIYTSGERLSTHHPVMRFIRKVSHKVRATVITNTIGNIDS